MIDRATDANLLRRFAEGREEAAFAELVERHGPNVRRVCRRFLRSEHDAEDVFQATFLLLALRASDVAWRASIGGWVYDVARRLALNARGEIARRRRREMCASSLAPDFRFGDAGPLPNPECPLSAFTEEVERRDVRRAIDVAVEDLPEKYRDPLVLCYLEGKTNHEAAATLGYPVGSMSRRLDRARELLRSRLIGRGVTLGLILTLITWIATGQRLGNKSANGPIPDRLAFTRAGSPAPQSSELRELLTALERNEEKGLNRSRLAVGAAHAENAADRAPAARRESSRNIAAGTRRATHDLDRADGRAASATRLLATCVRCHVAFR